MSHGKKYAIAWILLCRINHQRHYILLNHVSHLYGTARSGQEYAPFLSTVRHAGIIGRLVFGARVGPGRIAGDHPQGLFDTEEEALLAGQKLRDAKQKLGYRLRT
jgi:hypothetical protein